ncbi:hypothetical protein [Gibbsiella quercinecans]|uniref:hypothetical protein n=1 Tax=Gibbsiella quercinecans TaxID=929813 RepID=UPI0011C4236A|nr:hypothetical protein [Gibbsiella quercinecans]
MIDKKIYGMRHSIYGIHHPAQSATLRVFPLQYWFLDQLLAYGGLFQARYKKTSRLKAERTSVMGE